MSSIHIITYSTTVTDHTQLKTMPASTHTCTHARTHTDANHPHITYMDHGTIHTVIATRRPLTDDRPPTRLEPPYRPPT